MGLLILCFVFAGCHSTRFGPILESEKSKRQSAQDNLHIVNGNANGQLAICNLQFQKTEAVRAVFGPVTEDTPVSPATTLQASPPPPTVILAGGTQKSANPALPNAKSEKTATPFTIPPPVLDDLLQGCGIDLATALRLAGVENPTVALAEEVVRQRQAEELQARALLLPTAEPGTNIRMHRGEFQNSSGKIIEVNLQSLYYGFGAYAVGTGTVLVPGLRFFYDTTELLYAPKAAQQRVVQSQLTSLATRNTILQEVGNRYLDLVGAQAQLVALRQSLQEAGAVERITTEQARTGQGRESDAERARSETLLLGSEAERAREGLEVAAAELARLLNLDPAQELRAAEVTPPMIDLVDPRLSLERLLEIARANNPELSASSAEVQYQQIRLRQERARPFLPIITMGLSAGEYGGGSQTTSSHFGSYNSRIDMDLVAIWSLQNLGLGNHARQKIARADWEQAQSEQMRVYDRLRRDVAEAFSLIQARRREIELAQHRVLTAQRAFLADLDRTRNLLGRPIEVNLSVLQLSTARQDLVRAMIGYGQAQFQLYAALGNAPTP
jgi:outer membrane protein TolC